MKESKSLLGNGLKISHPLPTCCEKWDYRVAKQKKASLIIITGGVGEGKTTLATLLADTIRGENIVFDQHLGLGGNDFVQKFYGNAQLNEVGKPRKEKVVIYDEAGDFNSQGAITRFNQMLNRLFDTCRTFKLLIILILPDWEILDKRLFRKGIVRAVIRCHDRNNNYGKFDMWIGRSIHFLLFHLKNKKVIVKEDAYGFVYPWARGYFKDLTPERSLLLDKYTTQGKQDIGDSIVVAMNGFLTYKELAYKLNRSVIWVKKKISSEGINESKIVKRVKYFHPDVLNVLATLIDEIGD